MGTIVAFELVTLEGVMQAPARADEDIRGGFAHGGWATPYADAVSAGFVGQGGQGGGAGGLLFGRRTYEDFFQVWPNRAGNPFTAALNNQQKYVVSRNLAEPLPWMNSTLLKGDASKSVSRLKSGTEAQFVILGSGALVRALMRDNLIDEFILLIHPIVLGAGQRLFDEAGTLARLRLLETKPTTTGVVIARYRAEA
jgi:dihydrofolate reductase